MERDEKNIMAAHARINAHEELCAERYENIKDTFKEVKGWLRAITLISISSLLAMTGWLAVNLFAKIH